MQENVSDPLIKEFNNRLETARVFYGLAAHVQCGVQMLAVALQGTKFDRCTSFLMRVRVPHWPAPHVGRSSDLQRRLPGSDETPRGFGKCWTSAQLRSLRLEPR